MRGQFSYASARPKRKLRELLWDEIATHATCSPLSPGQLVWQGRHQAEHPGKDIFSLPAHNEASLLLELGVGGDLRAVELLEHVEHALETAEV